MSFVIPQDAVLMGEMAVALMAAWGARTLTRPLGQPAVVAEILAGVVLGPSLLGLLPGHPTEVLFPASGRSMLTSVAQIGVVLFMFIVGWEFDFSVVRARRTAVNGIMFANFLVPFVAGAALAFALYHHDGGIRVGHHVAKPVFVIYLGVALGITAFPVLARILEEHRLLLTPLGQTALAAAAGTDLFGWIGIACVVFALPAAGSVGAGTTLVLAVVYLGMMCTGVRLGLRAILRRSSAHGAGGVLALVVAGLLLSACVSSLLGLHAVLGAFVFGLVMPREPRALLALEVAAPMKHAGTILMPAYFLVQGLNTDITSLGWSGLALALGLIVVGSAAKGGAVFAAARLYRFPRHAAFVLGVMMNTRGLTEIVVLNIGLSLGVIGARLFTALLIMTIVTTAITGPLLHWLEGGHDCAQDGDVAGSQSGPMAAFPGQMGLE